MSELATWVVELVAQLDRYGDEHPKLYAQYAGSDEYRPADCPCHLLALVPDGVRAYAQDWRAGREDTEILDGAR